MKETLLFIGVMFAWQYSLAQRGRCVSPECQEIIKGISGNNSLIFMIEIFLFVISTLAVVTYLHRKPRKTDKDRNDP